MNGTVGCLISGTETPLPIYLPRFLKLTLPFAIHDTSHVCTQNHADHEDWPANHSAGTAWDECAPNAVEDVPAKPQQAHESTKEPVL